MNTGVEYAEFRVITRPKLNHVFVWIRTVSGEQMIGVDGWHYKATTRPSLEFLTDAFTGKDSPEPSDREEYEALE